MRKLCVAACATTVAAVSAAGAQAATDIQGESSRFGDRDTRTARVAPSAEQRRLAREEGLKARWNRFGTAEAVSAPRGAVARGLPGDPVAAARQWIAANRDLLGIDSSRLRLVASNPIGDGRAVLLRQRFGSLPAGRDGMIAVGVRDGAIAYVSSSLAPDTTLSGARALSAAAAVRAAAADARLRPDTVVGKPKLVAVPTPRRGNRRAWQVQLLSNGAEPRAVSTFVDAENGTVLVRENLVDHLADNPTLARVPELSDAELCIDRQPGPLVLDGGDRM